VQNSPVCNLKLMQCLLHLFYEMQNIWEKLLTDILCRKTLHLHLIAKVLRLLHTCTDPLKNSSG